MIEKVKRRIKVIYDNIYKNSRKRKIISAFCAFFLIIISCFLMIYYINLKGRYPWGSDAFGHIFKSDLLYKNIKSGNFYPLYTELWYNGIQPFRYWAPIPYYIMAGFQFLAKGDAILAYNYFVAFCFIFGALGWILWGIKEDRIFLSAIIGILWFCMPDNIRVFFSEGNMPRVVIALFMPYFLYYLWLFVEYKKKNAIILVVLIMTVISLSHLMIAAMFGITMFLFLLYYSIIDKSIRYQFISIIGMLLGISLCGVWLYPALQGGLMSINSEAVSEVMKALTFPFTFSLNPGLRLKNIEIYYFGLSFFVISLLGILTADKKSKAGFFTVLTVFLGTTTAFVPILIKMPLNQLLWMMRFTPIAYAVFCIGIMTWKKLRRYILILFIIVIGLDSGVSFKILAYNTNPPADTVHMLEETVKATDNRVAIMDLSEFGSFPSYFLCIEKNNLPYAFGWAWQGATTSQNIVMLNTALEKGYFNYLFDRCIELGCDTVLIKKNHVKDLDMVLSYANKNQYNLIKEFNNGYLFKRNTPKRFGMKVKYYGLAIGESAINITLDFPGFQIGTKTNINEYTLEELLQYRIIFLSDFTYDNKNKAEQMLLKAAEQGVKIVIDMNRIPSDPITHRTTFFDVTAEPIIFYYQLPDLHIYDDTYYPVSFKEEFKSWNTIYLDKVPNPIGYALLEDKKLTFIGKHTNTNITFIGFNILYHGIANEDRTIINVFGTVMGEMVDTLPDREIVPIDVEIKNNKITIDTEGGEILTTFANLDAFYTENEIDTIHNLLVVKEPHTEIEIIYPHFKKGVILSIAGLICTIIFLIFVLRIKN